MLFDVQLHERDGWIVLSVVGELDLAAAPRTRQAVVDALAARTDPPQVVLDLGSVDFIDSSGLGVVLGVQKRVRLAHGRLRVVVREPHVRRLFEVTELDRILPLVASVEEAMAHAASPNGSGRDG